VRSGAIDVLVVDSVAALVPKAELDGEDGRQSHGLQARLMSQALRKLTGTVSKSRTCLIFINQIREKIGVMFGNPETTTGGRALKFYSSVRIDIRRIAAIKEGDVVTGSRTKIKVVKTKWPHLSAKPNSTSMYGRGNFARRRSARHRRSSEHRGEIRAPGTATKASASARDAKMHAPSSKRIKTQWSNSKPRCASNWA